MKNSVLDNFPLCPPAHPPWKAQILFLLSSRFLWVWELQIWGPPLCEENQHWIWPREGSTAKTDWFPKGPHPHTSSLTKTIGKRLMGGQNVSCDFGGGKRTIERGLQNQFWMPQKVGFAWSVPVSSEENNRRKQTGGENVS